MTRLENENFEKQRKIEIAQKSKNLVKDKIKELQSKVDVISENERKL